MAFDLTKFNDAALETDYVVHLVEDVWSDNHRRLSRLWDYFSNPMTDAAGLSAAAVNANSRPYFQAQEAGLPARITGISRVAGGQQPTDISRKEVVIENDIAWRIQTMTDFLFPAAPAIRSAAGDRRLGEAVERIIAAVLEANGGLSFMHELSLFGSVYGFADVALRIPSDISLTPLPRRTPASAGSNKQDPGQTRSKPDYERAVELARKIHLETIEAPRVLPILADDDYRRVRYWIQRFHKHPPRMQRSARSWLPWQRGKSARPASVEVVEIIGPRWWQHYRDRQLVAEGPNPLGRAPVVHIQNIALPGCYGGAGDVAPLVGLQDELNTRLSDRANRITYQSFKMYLGKGIDDFLERPVGPGQMWATNNLQAGIEEFGSDPGSPSEEAHIEQVRQAMDKVSGVTPLAAGLIRGGVGNLTSATALKVVLAGLLAKTRKKRLTYGAGLERIATLVLEWLDLAGVLKTRPRDREIEITWPDAMPLDQGEQLRNARIKAQLGVPAQRILAELGYDRRALKDDNQ